MAAKFKNGLATLKKSSANKRNGNRVTAWGPDHHPAVTLPKTKVRKEETWNKEKL
jgi:hypothetical protein